MTARVPAERGRREPAGYGPVVPIEEPVYDRAARQDVQGNIVPGFNKPHQQFMFLRIDDPVAARRWVAGLAPQVTSMDEALGFVRELKARRRELRTRDAGLSATWENVAFSFRGIELLGGAGAAAGFAEESFRQGLAARSTHLGDPTTPYRPGHRDGWVVGGPGNEADVLVIVAADDPDARNERAAEIRAGAHGLEVLYEEPADVLPDDLHGHEHFGFRDGVSQPGVRGRCDDGSFLTERFVDADALEPGDVRADLFARPGQALVWPGQFLLGEPRQDTESLLAPAPPAARPTFPAWAARGSYLVCRRLLQDVPAFRAFTEAAAGLAETSPEHLAALLVGRWPSGAPLMRAASADDPKLADDLMAVNHFLFDDDTRALRLVPGAPSPPDRFPQATADVLGRVCPHFSHIRKMNPRESGTDLGKPADTLLRLMLRRGITFGPPLAGVPDPSPELIAAERGLMFVCYGATIEDQFEFVTRRWANSPILPNHGGHDPIIGQRDTRGDRRRFVEVPGPDGGVRRIDIDRDFVVPTGGGYFLAPPISALTGVLGG